MSMSVQTQKNNFEICRVFPNPSDSHKLLGLTSLLFVSEDTTDKPEFRGFTHPELALTRHRVLIT